jgi:hypothetical protein
VTRREKEEREWGDKKEGELGTEKTVKRKKNLKITARNNYQNF